MRAFIFLAALLCSLSCFAADRCEARVPTATDELCDVRLAYQSIGGASDPPLRLVLSRGG
ncbi:alpha/beta fold hydrolase, partial [Pseudomonas aeruginosa]